ncbi:hypothetical protein HK100_006094 [Physocladia obscura]|uniref:endo-polygalacturonase n=1 Tax=Physocladia obscura TaxID=109957 RepID=A0AAD5XFA3_9FUNG|nr:hypothetical protein HK100_006094 [Physocladia obscura]
MIIPSFLVFATYVTVAPLDKRAATCVVSSYAGFASCASSTNIHIQGPITVPTNSVIDWSSLKSGTQVLLSGTVTFTKRILTESGPKLITVGGSDITFKGDSSNPGILDGQSSSYWDGKGSNRGVPKPKFFSLETTGKSRFFNFKILNAPVQSFSIGGSGTTIDNVKVDNSAGDALGHNTDGFDVSAASIIIQNSWVYNQDDCLAGNSANDVHFLNNICIGGHGISIGSVASGSVVENVTVKNCTVQSSTFGACIKTDYGATSGSVSSIIYEDITLVDISTMGIVVRQDYQNGSPKGTAVSKMPITGVTMSNIHGTITSGADSVFILCATGECTGFDCTTNASLYAAGAIAGAVATAINAIAALPQLALVSQLSDEHHAISDIDEVELKKSLACFQPAVLAAFRSGASVLHLRGLVPALSVPPSRDSSLINGRLDLLHLTYGPSPNIWRKAVKNNDDSIEYIVQKWSRTVSLAVLRKDRVFESNEQQTRVLRAALGQGCVANARVRVTIGGCGVRYSVTDTQTGVLVVDDKRLYVEFELESKHSDEWIIENAERKKSETREMVDLGWSVVGIDGPAKSATVTFFVYTQLLRVLEFALRIWTQWIVWSWTNLIGHQEQMKQHGSKLWINNAEHVLADVEAIIAKGTAQRKKPCHIAVIVGETIAGETGNTQKYKNNYGNAETSAKFKNETICGLARFCVYAAAAEICAISVLFVSTSDSMFCSHPRLIGVIVDAAEQIGLFISSDTLLSLNYKAEIITLNFSASNLSVKLASSSTPSLLPDSNRPQALQHKKVSLTIRFIDPATTGKSQIVNITKSLARSALDAKFATPQNRNQPRFSDTIDLQMMDQLLAVPNELGDPDLLYVFQRGPAYAPLTLHNYPPWELRLTEI